LDLAIAENLLRGMNAQEARTAALRAFGGITQTRETYRLQRGLPFLQHFARDLRFAFRQLRRAPGFTLTAVVTLALSIGANTAIFSIVNALMLKSLPYADPERIGTIFMRVQGPDPFDGLNDVDGEQWELLRDNVPSLQGAVSSEISSGVNLQAGRNVQYVHAGRVSAHYFDVLGIHPAIGRSFTDTEDRPHGPNAVVLSYGLWRSIFHADPHLIGQAIQLKGEPYTVVGILPAGAKTPLNADVYTALQPSRQGEGGGANFGIIVRLRIGANWQQADAELNRVWANRALRYAKEFHPGSRVSFYTIPLQKGQTAELRPKALALMLAAGFILLIACANLAGLTVVRMARRTSEIATRLALGASRWHVQRQLWIENLVLALIGGAVGVGVAFLALRGLLSLLPLDYLPVAGVPLDGRVLAFALAASILTSVLCGMLPALAIKTIDLRSYIASRTIAGGERLRLRQTLIAGEVALTVVLLAASGLLIRTLVHLQTLQPGFNPQNLMTAKASLDDARFRDPAAFDQLLMKSTAAMNRIPGVQSAAVGLSLPYERALNDGMTLGSGPMMGQQVMSGEIYVTPSYFETLQIPFLAGRTFTSSDQRGTQLVAIVNRAFVRKYFAGANPVGQKLDKQGTLIIGVAQDVALPPHAEQVNDPLGTEPITYIPATQVDPRMIAVVHIWFQPSWIVRPSGPIEGLTGQMQRALASVDPGLPFSGFYNMSDHLAETLATQRAEVALLSAMAGLALLLSAIGIFALVASLVAQRSREIGIRIALGSTIRQAMLHIAGSGLRASALGFILGLILCAGALRILRSALFGVGVYDAPSIFAAVLTLALVTLLATSIPVLRIASINPATTLRDE
ncbi:MAG TPA: ABC transporter permease, partial [Terracidiphilus sp.]|nr:ABC transporter permease [Terracidiphilus sp.]